MYSWKPMDTAPLDRPILVEWESHDCSTIWPSKTRVTVAYFMQNHPMPHWAPTDAGFMPVLHPTRWCEIPS